MFSQEQAKSTKDNGFAKTTFLLRNRSISLFEAHFVFKNQIFKLVMCIVTHNFTYICTFGFGFGIRPRARCFSGQIFGFGLM